jgi:hypothetical protein
MRFFAAVLMSFAASSVASAQSGLSGSARNDFVESAFRVCLQKRMPAARSEAQMARTAQYCVCYADRLADRISSADNNALDELFAKDKVELAARLQPILEGVAESCAYALAP